MTSTCTNTPTDSARPQTVAHPQTARTCGQRQDKRQEQLHLWGMKVHVDFVLYTFLYFPKHIITLIIKKKLIFLNHKKPLSSEYLPPPGEAMLSCSPSLLKSALPFQLHPMEQRGPARTPRPVPTALQIKGFSYHFVEGHGCTPKYKGTLNKVLPIFPIKISKSFYGPFSTFTNVEWGKTKFSNLFTLHTYFKLHVLQKINVEELLPSVLSFHETSTHSSHARLRHFSDTRATVWVSSRAHQTKPC